MKIPQEFTAGDTVSWDDDAFSDDQGNEFKSSDYTLTYYIRGMAVTALNKVAAVNGDGWRTTLASADTLAVAAGVYYWEAKVTKTGFVRTVGKGSLRILANASGVSTANFDGRSQARIDLENCQATIRALTVGGVKSYTFQNRSMTKLDIPELLKLESKYKFDVSKEEKAANLAAGRGNGNALYARFKK